jgi:hypothetical protein
MTCRLQAVHKTEYADAALTEMLITELFSGEAFGADAKS